MAEVAEKLELGRFIRLTPGEQKAGTAEQASVLADAMEAVIGAIYRDGGLEAVRPVIERLWAPLMTAEPLSDAKTALQEWVQARGEKLPVYKTIAADGPPHAPVFTVEASIDGLDPVRSKAGSKRAAERAAAGELLARAKAGRD